MNSFIRTPCTLFLLLLFPLLVPAQGFKSVSPSALPDGIRFIENQHQWVDWIRYRAGFSGGDVLLTNKGFVYYLMNPADAVKMHLHGMGPQVIHNHCFTEEFSGANPDPSIIGQDPYPDYNNYFIGKDPAHWAGQVPIDHSVEYVNLYPGIDMTVRASGYSMVYDLLAHPGSNPALIRIQFKGQDRLGLKNGHLLIETSVGTVTEEKPECYQVIDGGQVKVPCRFVLEGNTLSYAFPKGYDSRYLLVIDPQLIFSTYTGSTADNFGYTATYDAQGDLYLGGYVNCYNFNFPPQITGVYPTTPGAFDISWNGGSGHQSGNGQGIGYACDMGITKFNPTGTTLLYSTYLGGSDNDTPNSLFVNSSGQLLVMGRSYSTDYPITAGAFQQTHNDTLNAEIVVTCFNAAGSALIGSTYVGGTGNDGVNYSPSEFAGGHLKFNYADDGRGEIIADAAGNVYVASCTYSVDFPVTPGAFQTTNAGGLDGVVFKLNPLLTGMIYSTYIGGSSDDACYSLDLWANTVYVCGGTMSSNFPSTGTGWNPAYIGGTTDGFLSHLNASGTALLGSTFLGTSQKDQAYFVKLDGSGDVYCMGQTFGVYPVLNAAYSNANSGQFITKLQPSLSNVVYSTVFGNGAGQPNISPTAFLVDTCQNVYVCGWGGVLTTNISPWPFSPLPMTGMPTTPNAFQLTTDGRDFYLFVLKRDALSMLYGTYFGGVQSPASTPSEHVDGGTSRFDRNGIVYEAICAGCGGNSTVPTTPGAWSTTNHSQNCNELGFKMSINLFEVTAAAQANPAATGCKPLTVNFVNNSQNATNYFWFFSDPASGAQDSSNLFQPTHTFNDTGTYQIMLVAWDPTSCGPPDTAYTSVVVLNTMANATFTQNLTDLCDSLVAHFTGSSNSAATQYSWSFGDTTFSGSQNPAHTYHHPGLYTVTLYTYDSTACNPRDTFSQVVAFTSQLQASIATDSFAGCSPLIVPFTNTSFNGTSYQWFFGDGTNSSLASPTHTYSIPGTYYVLLVVHDTGTCNPTDTAYATVVVFPSPPHALFTAAPLNIQLNTPVNFTNLSTGATHYWWQFGDGDTSSQVNPSHEYGQSGDYNACLFAYNGGPCPDKYCLVLKIRLLPIIDVPNAFSPNNDGHNDVAYVEGQDVATMTWKIFNRWGQKVFESHSLSDGWNGIFNGKAQDMDVYTWTLEATFNSGGTVSRSGNLTLIR